MGTLSVRENLLFSAALRLPSSTSWDQRRDRVEKVIQELGLDRCADTKVGMAVLLTLADQEKAAIELLVEKEQVWNISYL